ncbi:MAG: archaetidylserine decarboxylase [Myxococcota bacterium]|nr:archaetidylserine decarboxylase [Myxococcota bacterium]
MNDALIVSMLSIVPKNPVARGMGTASRLRLPAWLHRALVRWFVGKYGVDLSECEGEIDDFPTLADFFVRPLKAGVRPVDPDPDVVVSPVDARAHTFGQIKDGMFLQAEGQPARVAQLLGADDPRLPGLTAEIANRYEGGQYAVLYLSPKDYHRVHTPLEGTVARWRYLPGQLWPVFPAATRKVAGLFGRNERLLFELDTSFGRVAEVMVGAFGVGRMSSTVTDLVTNTGGRGVDAPLAPPLPIERAGEIGRFHLGSTVILLFEPGQIEWTLEPGQAVRLGRPIARRASNATANEDNGAPPVQ